MLKAIIFDFDGVIADTYDKNLEIFREIFKDLDEETFKDHHNGNVYEKPAVHFSEEESEYFFAEYLKRAHADRFFPIMHHLTDLAEEYKLFIISSNSEESINKYLELTATKACFTKVYGMETEKSKKKKFRMTFEEYSLLPSECVFITDTLGDLLEANLLEVPTIAVTWGYHDETRLKYGKPHNIIHEFDDLPGAIDSFNTT